jgi:hypothetical protein
MGGRALAVVSTTGRPSPSQTEEFSKKKKEKKTKIETGYDDPLYVLRLSEYVNFSWPATI